jgi:large subunit ribosomal protein L25
MSILTLAAQIRTEAGRKTNKIREAGKVPAIVYGSGTEPTMLTVDRNQFVKSYKDAGESSIVELAIDGAKPLHVLIQDFQLDPLRDEVTHIDFRSVDMTKEIEAEVELEFVGESMAMKALGGTFVPSKDSVAVRCLPSKLVRKLMIDISILKTFDDVIRISDIVVPEGMTIEDDANTTLAAVQAPRSEAEMDELNKVVELDVTAVEVEKKAKEDAAAAEEKK